MAYVVAFIGDRVVARVELRQSLSVGRSPESDLMIPDIQVSRKHCEIEETSGGWVVRDLDSRNGTYVGGMEVGEFVLSDGDEIRIGHATLRFCEGKPVMTRPADPKQALDEARADPTGMGKTRDVSHLPRPKPRAWGPGAAGTDDPSAGSTGYFGDVTAAKKPGDDAKR